MTGRCRLPSRRGSRGSMLCTSPCGDVSGPGPRGEPRPRDLRRFPNPLDRRGCFGAIRSSMFVTMVGVAPRLPILPAQARRAAPVPMMPPGLNSATAAEDHEALQVSATSSAFRFRTRPDRPTSFTFPATVFDPPTIENCEQLPCKDGAKSRALTPDEPKLTPMFSQLSLRCPIRSSCRSVFRRLDRRPGQRVQLVGGL